MLLTGRGIQTPEEDIRYRGLANPYFIKLFYRALQKDQPEINTERSRTIWQI